MGRFLHVLCGETTPLIRDFALLALYTGARKSNVLEMEWDNRLLSKLVKVVQNYC
ncbi:integrase [Orientia tsutsugamushi]|nr:integrase [Orientia tsutsugamushi]